MCILLFKSGKFYRVVKSAMVAEAIVLAAAFDSRFTMQRQIQLMLGNSIPLYLLTANKCLFEALASKKSTTEGRPVLGNFAARQGYSPKDTDSIRST